MVYCSLLVNKGKSAINLKILYVVVEIINCNIKVVLLPFVLQSIHKIKIIKVKR